jgi:exonuclease VII small subunit
MELRMVSVKVLFVMLILCVLVPSTAQLACAKTGADQAAGQISEQQNAFDDAFAGYKDARDVYSDAKQETDDARGKTQLRLLDKAKMFMLHANKAAIRYLDVLTGRIEQVQGIPDDRREAMLKEIQADSEWLVKTQSDIKDAKSIDELRAVAKRFREHWRNYRGVSKRVSGLVLHEKLASMISRAETASVKVQGLTVALKGQGKDTGKIEDSLKELNSHLAAAKEKNVAAKVAFENRPSPADANSTFKEGMKLVKEAHRELKEAHSHLIDINKEIKSVIGGE